LIEWRRTFIQVWRERIEDRRKGAAMKIVSNQQDRRTDIEVCTTWLSVLFVFLKWVIFPSGEPRIITINLIELVFPLGFFHG
jgi:hypothetical protein